jgi:transposase
MKPYSQDLRERMIRAVEAQEGSQAAIAQRFAVSRSFVEKLWQRWRRTHSCAALPHAGGRQRSLRAAESLLRQAVARNPDVTLAALCERVARHKGIAASTKTMCLEVQRLRLPRKKSRSLLLSARRRAWAACVEPSAGG